MMNPELEKDYMRKMKYSVLELNNVIETMTHENYNQMIYNSGKIENLNKLALHKNKNFVDVETQTKLTMIRNEY